MTQRHLFILLTLIGLGAAPRVASAVPPTPPQAPTNVKDEPSTPQSARLTSRAASAEMARDPQAALKLAERAIAAEPRDPWGYYDKGAALSRIGKVDDALLAFANAEQRYSLSDQWGRSVAIYGRAHVLGEARRCDEAKREFTRYASLIHEKDPKSADLALRYARDCKSPVDVPFRASN
jgi:tetratricopeptide (TPR) repeat protein